MKRVLRILLVEDSEDDVHFVLYHIRKSGYETKHRRVETSDSMAKALADNTWDIVLSDYVLPHFHGLDALKVLKKSGIDFPFIIVSGTVDEDVAVEAMIAGAHDNVMKDNLNRLLPSVELEISESTSRVERKHFEQKTQESTEDIFEINQQLLAEIYERKKAEVEILTTYLQLFAFSILRKVMG